MGRCLGLEALFYVGLLASNARINPNLDGACACLNCSAHAGQKAAAATAAASATAAGAGAPHSSGQFQAGSDLCPHPPALP